MLYNKDWEKPAVKLEPWQEHLLKAAQLLREKGWCQGASADARGAYCAAMAISIATNYPASVITDAVGRFLAHVGKPRRISDWNDAPGRTKEEVIAALEAAAKGE